MKTPPSLLSYTPEQQGFFSADDGTALYYEVAGKGPPLLFCYGLVCRREHWRHQLDYYVQRYRVIAFDYRGHQRSAVPANSRNLTLDWCARDAAALLRHLQVPEVVVMGHSMGVPIATLLATKLPEVVKGLGLICGTVTNPFDGMFHSNRMMVLYEAMEAVYQLSPRLMGSVWKRITDLNQLNFLMTSRLGFNPYLAERSDVLSYMVGVNQTPLSVFFNLISDYVRHDGRENLKQIACPALVIAGTDDLLTPFPLQEEMARLIPKAELVKIAMGSHNAHSDVPEMVNERLDHFLAKIPY